MDPRHYRYTRLLIGRNQGLGQDQADEQTARELGFDSAGDLRKEISRHYAICERCGEEWPTVSHNCPAGSAIGDERRSARVRGAVEELPPVERAEALFREALGGLVRQLPWLERRREYRRGRRFVASHALSGRMGESILEYQQRDFGPKHWVRWCRERGLDPKRDHHQVPHDYEAPLAVPTDHPMSPLPELIAVYALTYGDVGELLEVLHPTPATVDRGKLDREVATLRRSAERVAAMVRGGAAGAGKRAPEITADERRLAAHIKDMRDKEFPVEWIVTYLKNGGISPLPAGFYPTEEEVERLAALNIS